MATGQGDTRVACAKPADSRYFLALAGGIGWLVGIWLASVTNLSLAYWLLMGLAATIAAIATWHMGRTGLILAGFAALALGAARYVTAQPVTDPGQIHYYNGRPNMILTARLIAEPEKHDTFSQLRLDAVTVEVAGQVTHTTGTLLVQTDRFAAIPYGSIVRLEGALEPPESLGSLGYAAYLRRQGILSVMHYPAITIVASENEGASPLVRTLLSIRKHGREVIRQALTEPQASLLNGILLGDDSGMPRETVEAFRTTGMTHVIAISGFNIALLIVLLDRLAVLFLPRRVAAMVIMTFVGLYAVLVGGAASVVRAALMGVAYLFATRMLGRPTLAAAILLVTAFLMTLHRPLVLWDVGFQLSFAATTGLVLFAGQWTTWTKQRLSGDSDSPARWGVANFLADVVIVTLAAQILTVPLLLYHFGRLSLASLPANILVLPVQPAVMMTGAATLLLGWFLPAAGRLAGWLAWPFLAYTTGVVSLLARLPWASVPLRLTFGGVIAVYLIIAVLAFVTIVARRPRSERTKIQSQAVAIPVSLAALAVVAVLMISQSAARRPDGRLHVFFLDVGQGDATFIQTPSGRQILIDGGRYPSILLGELGRHMPFWDHTIDMVIATHPDEDHIAGLIEVVDRYRVDQLLTNNLEVGGIPAFEALVATAHDRATPVSAAQVGEILDTGDGVRLEVLHPNAEFHSERQNDSSLVTRLTFGQLAIMLVGDAEAEAEAELLRGNFPLTAVVLKAGHHGANTSSGEAFLKAVQPQIIVISVGEDNSYGHPHPAMLDRAATIGATVLRTDELGTIEMMSDGLQMWWQSRN